MQNLVDIIKLLIFAPVKQNAEIAQLVEHNLAKVRVASSSLVFRSLSSRMLEWLNVYTIFNLFRLSFWDFVFKVVFIFVVFF